jgi:FtsP/CotA-like multicopper oxidase with cupredoxin domain
MSSEHKERPAMRSLAHTKTKALVVLAALGVLGTIGSALPASAASVSVDLCATTGTATMPGAMSVPIWGFALKDAVNGCTGVTAQLPGPVIEANVGDVVTVTVDSSGLPGGRSAPLELPGLAVDDSVAGIYTFTVDRPGTFTYESSGDAGRQMAMGLYGALVVRPVGEPAAFGTGTCSSGDGQAYGSAFERDCVLVLSTIDPDFNSAPDSFDMHSYLATYWLINGKPYDPAAPDPIEATSGERLLLRYVNAGFDNTTMTLLGTHEHVLARDAFPLLTPIDVDAETLGAGSTEDVIVTVPSFAPPNPNGFPLYNRQVHVTNGSPGTYPGGQLTFIKQVP